MGLHRDNDDDSQKDENQEHRSVRLASLWGAFTLDKLAKHHIIQELQYDGILTALSSALSFAGSLPTTYMPSLPPQPPIVEATEQLPWISFRDNCDFLVSNLENEEVN